MPFEEASLRYLRHTAIEIESPESLNLKNNWVLVKIEEDFLSNLRQLKSGIYLDISWRKEENSILTGVVSGVPKKLIYKNTPVDSISVVEGKAYQGIEAISEYDTDMELLVGDLIYYNYLSFQRAIDTNMVFIDNTDKVYILVRYDKITCAIRNGDIIPVNGHILIEKTVQQVSYNSKFIHLIGNKNVSENVGIARFVGKPLRRYFSMVSKDGERYRDAGFILPGDVLFFWGATNIENEIMRGEDFNYLKCQEMNIIAIVRGGELFVNSFCFYVKKLDNHHSKIIDFKNSKNFAWNYAEVLESNHDHPDMKGSRIYYQKTYDVKFDYNSQEYNFVFNAFSRVQLPNGEWVVQD